MQNSGLNQDSIFLSIPLEDFESLNISVERVCSTHSGVGTLHIKITNNESEVEN